MPLSNPTNAINHIYPGIQKDQYTFRDDGSGIYLGYLDPALGDPPTQAELEQAELDYVAPSYLDGGTREPGLSDIEQNLLATYNYFRWRVGEKVKEVAKRYGFSKIERDSAGNFVETGQMEKAAKYKGQQNSPFASISSQMTEWESDVWEYLQTRWALIDPRGDFTGFDGVTPPTWPQIENDIDTYHPEP